MCGISGIFSSNSSQNEKETILNRYIKTQHHRGPDASGTYIDNIVGLAHNRLSILDLSANGNQPFTNQDHVLVFNGEIYNFQALKTKLKHHAFTSNSDTEVLFYLLIEYGVERTLKLIKGMFAFAWYSKKDETLFLCRDRVGIKPLFYSQQNGEIHFASELKTLVLNGNYKHDPTKVLYGALGILEKSRDYTAFKHIKQVPPGHVVTITKKEVTKAPYFTLQELVNNGERQRLNNMNDQQVYEEFEHLLENATKSMLVSDANMGCFVSGGIDSSLISTYALNQRADLKLFTANVQGKHSEFADATKLAQSLNVNLLDYKFKKEHALRDLAKVTYHYDSPITTHFNAIPFSNVAGLTRQHGVKAVLTGEGADELFLGYPKLLTRKYDNLIRAPYRLIDSIYKLLPGFNKYLDRNIGSFGLLRIFEMAAQDFTRQQLRESGLKAYSTLNKTERDFAYLSSEMMQEHIMSLLWRNDRMGMINSIESRFPFLDEDVIAFALNLPIKHKIGRIPKFYNYKHPFLIDKKIVRQVARKHLPNALVFKRKNGFPTHDWHEVRVHKDFLKGGTVQELFGLNNASLSYLKNNISDYHFALISSVEIWSKLFIEKQEVNTVNELIGKHFVFVN